MIDFGYDLIYAQDGLRCWRNGIYILWLTSSAQIQAGDPGSIRALLSVQSTLNLALSVSGFNVIVEKISDVLVEAMGFRVRIPPVFSLENFRGNHFHSISDENEILPNSMLQPYFRCLMLIQPGGGTARF